METVQRVNWPKHCKAFIQFDEIRHSEIANAGRSASHEVDFICGVCRMKGSFDDFATDERLRLSRWAV